MKIITFKPVENYWIHIEAIVDTPKGEAQLEFWYRQKADGKEQFHPSSFAPAARIILSALTSEQRAIILAQRIMLRANNTGE